MVRSKLGLKILGLCAVLVGMFAFSSAAQAEVGAFWLVNGVKISEALLPTVEAETDVAGVLLTELGGKQIHLKCPTINLVGAHLVEPLGKILGKIDFKGCTFSSLKTVGGELVLQKACEPKNEGVAGLITTNSITGLIKLHKTAGGVVEQALEAVPTEAGGQFANIVLGPECAFGENLKIGGVFFLKDCLKQFLTDVVKHLVEELKELTKLNVNGGATKATIDGSAWAFLGGVHKGLSWAGHS
jgi:hypothetical protein